MTEKPPGEFAAAVYEIVAQIPKGQVMTYGQIAALCGSPRSSRIVGQVAHWGPLELPWQRVVNKSGGLAGGYTTGGREAHKRDLEEDGVAVGDDYTVDVDRLLWWPPTSDPSSQSGSRRMTGGSSSRHAEFSSASLNDENNNQEILKRVQDDD